MLIKHAAIRQVNHTVSHVRHHGIVRDDDGERAQITIHALDGFQDDNAGPHV